jgi:serine kinase of HPr protein (carbohydrate metabolism regulator)
MTMTLGEIASRLTLEVVTAKEGLDREVSGGYASDLLSDVMANAQAGDLWVTLQIHENIVAMATLKDLSGIVIVKGRQPQREAVDKAETEGIPILVASLPAFELVGRLHQMGIRGVR